METATETITKAQLKQDLPDIKPGDTIRVHQKVKEGAKERIQVFEGTVLAQKHGRGLNATMTVRKISMGVGVERIFPIHSPSITKIEVMKRSKVRRAKLYYLRDAKGARARLKAVDTKK
ncbi:MAG: 50S ribosomal protein L19 [Candidatus Yanofskybacteria bacterium]|nr:50S ribosomal protein L19 [Candidatus Yanofskybacteria bacterium]